MSSPENPDEPEAPADAVYYSDRMAYPAQGFPAGKEQAEADYLTKSQSGYLQQSHDSYLAQWQNDGTAPAQGAAPPQPDALGQPAPPVAGPGDSAQPTYPTQPAYPVQPTGYPAQSAGFGAQSAGFGAQSAGFGAQSAGYPGQDSYAATYGSAYGAAGYPAPGYPASGYPAPGYPAYPVRPSTNGKSVAALCVGLVGLFLTFCFLVSGFISGLAAILLGVFGLKQVNADPNPHGASKAMAITGIVVGAIQIVIAALLVVAIAADALN